MLYYKHNIFYHTHAPRQTEVQYEEQMEDSCTKALINTFEHAHPTLMIAFFRWLGISVSGWSRTTNRSTSPVRFTLNKADIGGVVRSQAGKHHILLLVPVLPDCRDFQGEPEQTHRPDAWVWRPGFVALFEVKVRAKVNPDQLKYYRKLLPRSGDIICRTWSDVHNWMRHWLNDSKEIDAKTSFLAKSFIKYLEGMTVNEEGMGSVKLVRTFTGLSEEHFTYFTAYSGDTYLRNLVVADVGELAKAVNDQLTPRFCSTHRGNMKKEKPEGCRVSLYNNIQGPSAEGHLTIGLRPYGLHIFANAETGTGLRSLLRRPRVRREQVLKELTCLMKQLACSQASYEMIIDDRRPLGGRAYQYRPALSMPCSFNQGDQALNYALDLLKQLAETLKPKAGGGEQRAVPALRFRTEMPMWEVLEKSRKSELVGSLVDRANELRPAIDFLNRPDH